MHEILIKANMIESIELVKIKACFAKHSSLDSQLGQSEIGNTFLFPLFPVLTQAEPAGGKILPFSLLSVCNGQEELVLPGGLAC